jgi:hypothetical protein
VQPIIRYRANNRSTIPNGSMHSSSMASAMPQARTTGALGRREGEGIAQV